MKDFRSLASLLPVVVWQSDPKGAFTFVSERWSELTGQPTSEALGFGWRQRVHPDDLPMVLAHAKDAFRHRVAAELETRLIGRAAPRWVRVAFAPERLANDMVSSFVGVMIDVTAARQAAVELEHRESRLRLLELRNQALLESLPDLLFQFDGEGRFVDFQAAPDTPLLASPTEFIGRPVEEVMPRPIALATRAAMTVARRTSTSQRIEYQLSANGTPRDYEARISPMRSGGYLALVREVTEQKVAERELIAAREQALTASSSKSHFLANVSHEIRTPLNGVIGVAQLLRTVELPPEAKEYVDVLEAAGESLLALVNEVLDLSKIEADRLELASEPFELGALVAQVARGFSADAQRKGLSLKVEIDGLAGPVLGDAGRVRQVVNNLVGNAIKFTSTGAVTVSLRREAGGFVLVVSDTGPGIPEAFQQSIFEPFVQVTGSRQGTGLGLSIARRVCQLMGGGLRLVRSDAQGSSFEAQLPLPEVASGVPLTRSGPTTLRRLRVLLAEDNEVNARLTRAMLAWLGHEVEVVNDGEAALVALSRRAFDVVLMDVHMPKCDGLEATRRVRATETGPRLPIVALTANAMKGDESACLAAGMDAYLAKPVTVKALSELLAGLGRAPLAQGN